LRPAFASLGVALVVAGFMTATASAATCEPPAGFVPRGRIESETTVVVFRTVPATIEIGRLFSLEAIVCTKLPGPIAQGLRVDAQMPEHRHGMNYRPRVSKTDESRYVAEGLLFHMPGRWELVFDVDRGTGSERLSTDLVLE
jgi:hypothetical protein